MALRSLDKSDGTYGRIPFPFRETRYPHRPHRRPIRTLTRGHLRPEPVDRRHDAGSDPGPDAGLDAGPDAGPGAGLGAGPGAGPGAVEHGLPLDVVFLAVALSHGPEPIARNPPGSTRRLDSHWAYCCVRTQS